MGTTGGSTFTANSGGGSSGLQWTIPSGLAPGTYSVKVTTGTNTATDPSTGSFTTCATAGGGSAAGVNASSFQVNYSTTAPTTYVAATPNRVLEGMSVTVSPSYYNASLAVLTGSNGSGVGTISNPPNSVQAITSTVGNVNYTLTAYGTVSSISWNKIQGFDQVTLSGGNYNNRDVSNYAPTSVSDVTMGTTYTLVYKQNGTGLTLTSTVTPSISGAKTSSATTPSVNSRPPRATITTTPTSVLATVGSDATFSGRADGNPAPTIQWQVSINGSPWKNIGDSGLVYTINQPPAGNDTTTIWQTSSLTLKNVTLAMNNYQFQFIATNNAGSATSNPPAILTVNPPTPPGSDVPAMPPLALGGLAASLLAAGYKFLPRKRHE